MSVVPNLPHTRSYYLYVKSPPSLEWLISTQLRISTCDYNKIGTVTCDYNEF